MSKKLKSKASSSPAEASTPPQFDKLKFISVKAWNWYNNELKKKTLIEERGIKFVEGWDYNIQQMTYDRDWEKFTEIPPPVAFEVVREFYANLIEAKGSKCYVRGKWVNFGPKAINSYYGTRNFASDAWSSYYQTEDVDIDILTKTICYGDVEWEMTRTGRHKHFKIGLLTEDSKVWYSFVMSRLHPGKHVSHVTLDRAKLVYAIVTRMEIDIGRHIYGGIMQTADTTATGIWFPSLITALCQSQGIVIGAEEHMLPPLLPIERVSKARFHTIYAGPDGRKTRTEKSYFAPSPPHGPPGVARQAPTPPSRRQSHRVTIEDKLDVIMARQDRQEEFMHYQYDWQMQVQNSMERMSLSQGVPQDEMPVFPALRPDFFYTSTQVQEDTEDVADPQGGGGWSPHIPAQFDPSAGTSSSWGPMTSKNFIPDDPVEVDTTEE